MWWAKNRPIRFQLAVQQYLDPMRIVMLRAVGASGARFAVELNRFHEQWFAPKKEADSDRSAFPHSQPTRHFALTVIHRIAG
jgi:hypothetical protein